MYPLIPQSDVMEADAGLVMYFDPFLKEWVTLGGGR